MPDSRSEVLRILYVRSRPLVGVDQLDDRLEFDKLVRIFDSAKLPLRLHLLPHAQARAFHLELGKGYDVVYFDGHGNEDSLVFEGPCGEPHALAVADFAAALQGSDAKLVFLSACESGIQLQALIQTGVNAAVGMTEAVKQPTAAAYAEAFFSELARGAALAQAHARGVTAIRLGLGVEPGEHEIPTLLPNDSGLTLAQPGLTGELEVTGVCSPTNVSLPDKPFIGRGEMMVSVNRALEKNRIVVLEGEGGIGKTALAQNVAVWQAERNKCPGGAAFVTFDPPVSRDQAIAVIGTTVFGADFEKAQGERLKLLIDHFKEQPGLVVFDNFESVRTDPEIHALIQALSPRARILVTTREHIDIGQTIVVKELDDTFAVMLFVVLAAQAGWDGTGDESTVKAICSELGNMPLAIELVAPQATTLPLHTVLERVKESLAAVAADRPDLPKRQRSLIASLDLSYNPLSDPAKLLFRRLSVFASSALGFTLPKVCDVEDWEKPTSELVEHRLVRFEANRYTMLPPVRRYAAGKLAEAGEKDKCEERFAHFFLSLASMVQSQMNSKEGANWIGAAGIERHNLLAAQRWFIEHDKWNEATGMADLLTDSFTRAGFWAARRDLYAPLRKYAEAESNKPALAAILHQLAMLAQDTGDLTEARELYDQSLAIEREFDNKPGIAQTLHQLGRLAQDQGDYAEARELYYQSSAIERELGDKPGIAQTLHQLAVLAQIQGDLAEARTLYDQSLAINEELANKSGIALAQWGLAMIAQTEGQLDEARDQYGEARAAFEELGDKRNLSGTLHQLGMLAQDQGDLAEARELYDQSLAINEELGNKSGIASALHQLGTLAEKQGDERTALKNYVQALAIFEELKSPFRDLTKKDIARMQHRIGDEAFKKLYDEVAAEMEPPTADG